MSTRTDPGSRILDLPVIFIHATDRAVLVRETEEGPEVWLPLAQVEIGPSMNVMGGELRRGGVATLSAPRWLLEREGLL